MTYEKGCQMIYFLISYLIVNLLIFLLAEHVNEKKANVPTTIAIALFGLPLFIIAGVMVLKGNKK